MKITFYVIKKFNLQILLFIYYLIKNKGKIQIVMQEDSFDNEYWIYKDGEDYIIQTSLIDLIFDIYECNK